MLLVHLQLNFLKHIYHLFFTYFFFSRNDLILYIFPEKEATNDIMSITNCSSIEIKSFISTSIFFTPNSSKNTFKNEFPNLVKRSLYVIKTPFNLLASYISNEFFDPPSFAIESRTAFFDNFKSLIFSVFFFTIFFLSFRLSIQSANLF